MSSQLLTHFVKKVCCLKAKRKEFCSNNFVKKKIHSLAICATAFYPALSFSF